MAEEEPGYDADGSVRQTPMPAEMGQIKGVKIVSFGKPEKGTRARR